MLQPACTTARCRKIHSRVVHPSFHPSELRKEKRQSGARAQAREMRTYRTDVPLLAKLIEQVRRVDGLCLAEAVCRFIGVSDLHRVSEMSMHGLASA